MGELRPQIFLSSKHQRVFFSRPVDFLFFYFYFFFNTASSSYPVRRPILTFCLVIYLYVRIVLAVISGGFLIRFLKFSFYLQTLST